MAFSEKAKLAVAVYQDVEIKGLHADHIFPKSKGGSDDVTNLQFLPPKVNMQKSNFVYQPRNWQIKGKEQYIINEKRDFMLVAVPASGKTKFACDIGRQFLDENPKGFIIVVSPSVNVQGAWMYVATEFGINLQIREIGTRAFRPDEYRGASMTYQGLGTYALWIKKQCHQFPSLIILDEVHHCGANASWGNNVTEAFELATKRLLLSGTPFRTDGQVIPYVSYDDEGVCIADHKYLYKEATADGVIRYLHFFSEKGKVTVFNGETEEHGELTGESPIRETERWLNKMLHADGEFVRTLIRQANEKLLEIRRSIKNAAAMLVCIDHKHANKMAKVLREVTGIEPAIIVSDDDLATSSVRGFDQSTQPWLVCVRQVSEGTDIPRLQVICYVTTLATQLGFQQLCGRISRPQFKEKQAPNENAKICDYDAFVYMPADPRLMKYAKEIDRQQWLALKEESETESVMQERSLLDPPQLLFVSSEGVGQDTAFIGNTAYQPTEAACITQLKSQHDFLDLTKAAQVFETVKSMLSKPMLPNAHPPTQQVQSLQDKEMAVRRKIQKLVGYLENKTEFSHQQIHDMFKPKTELMNLAQLNDKHETLKRWCAKGKIG